MFKFSDEVTININYVPNTNLPIEPGTVGIIVATKQMCRWSDDQHDEFYAVSYSDGTYWFAEEHLLPKGGSKTMPEPLFDLDDMEPKS